MNMIKLTITALLVAVGGAALAHGEHATANPGFLAGLTHPFTGLDHWIIAIALGVWTGHGLATGGQISQGSRLGLLLAATLYGASHGALLASGSYGAAFAAGLVVATLLLVLAGVIVQRAVAARRMTVRN